MRGSSCAVLRARRTTLRGVSEALIKLKVEVLLRSTTGTVEFQDEHRARAVVMRDGVADKDDDENDESENDNAQEPSRESFEHADLVRPAVGRVVAVAAKGGSKNAPVRLQAATGSSKY